jgi:hypothetical protein
MARYSIEELVAVREALERLFQLYEPEQALEFLRAIGSGD